MSIDKMTGGVV